MAVDDIWQGSIETFYQGNPNTYSWYFRAVAQATADDAADDILGEMDAILLEIKAIMPVNVLIRCTTARRVAPNFSIPKINILNSNGLRSPGVDDKELPGQCAMVVSLYGDKDNVTKHNRGRDYLNWFFCDDQSVGGKFENGSLAIMGSVTSMYQGIGNEFSGAPGNDYHIGVYSPSEKKAGKPVDEYFWQLEMVRAKQLVRTQRRRQHEDPCEEVREQVIG